MANLGITIAERLIEVIGCEIIKEICDIWGYKTQLEDLHKTVSTIKNVLLDADAKHELPMVAQGYIEDLKDAVYDADDLFDEFLTLAELKQLRAMKMNHNKFIEKLRCFFSSRNHLGQVYKMSRAVHDVKKRLDAIADKRTKFGFSVDYKPISRRRVDTCSYVDAKGIIGRESDKKVIVDMLVDPNVHEDFLFMTIVGVGGLGKTALAQLVYNDERVKKEFSSLRLWVCVSDHDGEQFDVRTILCKILELVTNRKFDGASTMELVQHLFQERMSGQKYFLVLDDVWNENREKWLELRKFLVLGQKGSRIIVTTRSEISATIIGDNVEKRTYKLKGLSQENSWRLFEISALNEGYEQKYDSEIVEIGKRIVEQCYNIPLAIKVVGSLLYGQDISKWRSVEGSGLTKIRRGENEIMSILKLSYHNLEPSLKSCFNYCAMFPKNFRIYKKLLISLWMAQGFVEPLDGGQSNEDAAEEHFLILLRRCFFQDVEFNEYGSITCVKIHDLMHDVAQGVGGKDVCVFSSLTSGLGDKTRHVSLVGEQWMKHSLSMTKIRSLIDFNEYHNIAGMQSEKGEYHKFVVTQVDMCTSLRALELRDFGVKNPLHSIGKLMHLRYLNLYKNSFEVLPDSITRLHNLQTLILAGCRNLRLLPRDLCKLIKIRHLDLLYCHNLISMPSGMDGLTNLRVLPFFIVNEDKRNSTEKQCDKELKNLKSLTNIEGNLCIKIGKNYRDVGDMNHSEEGYLRSMKHLNEVEICFDDECIDSEGVMGKLEPPSNIKGFILTAYKGTTIVRWGRPVDNLALSHPHLVKIELTFCEDLERMPLLSKLPHLKSLVLYSLDKLEYMEDFCNSTSSGGDESKKFFPSLEFLQISHLNSLKGWQRTQDDDPVLSRLFFPRLLSLKIQWCHNLMSFPGCLGLEALELREKIELLAIVNVRDQENTAEASSLRSFTFEGCNNLRSLSGLEHLTALESLEISGNEEMIICDDGGDDDDDGMPWRSLSQSLHSLTFKSLQNMRHLSKGMQHLTSLQSLQLSWCDTLETLPEWIDCLSSLQSMSIIYCKALKSLPASMRNLTSLKRLEIRGCANLEERYREPDGEDRFIIQHVPHIDISKWK